MGSGARHDLRGARRLIAVDTNVLVSAHRRDADHHDAAANAVRRLAEGSAKWAIPWPCAHEFLAIVTHPRIFEPPSTMAQAVAQLDAWARSPGISFLGEEFDHRERLQALLQSSGVVGGGVHDARVAAICLSHGVRDLWSADRDFSRFPELTTRDPLVG